LSTYEHELKALLESNAVRTLIALIAIGVSITIYLLNRKRKLLTVRVIARNDLVKLDPSFTGRIQITLDGRSVPDLSLVLLEIENTGNEPIKSDDFEVPLAFNFSAMVPLSSLRVSFLRGLRV
jgi:hypothetical protein